MLHKKYLGHLIKNKKVIKQSCEKISKNDFSNLVIPSEVFNAFIEHAVNNGGFIIFGKDAESIVEGRKLATFLSEKGEVELLNDAILGNTLIIRNANKYFTSLQNILDEFKDLFRGKLHCNLYLSGENSLGFPKHHDPHHVLAIQLFGSKMWKFYTLEVKYPTKDYHWELNQEQAPTLKTIVKENEFVSIPMGMVHEAKCNSKYSIHITIGIDPIRIKDLIISDVINIGSHLSLLRKPMYDNLFKDDKEPILTVDEKKIIYKILSQYLSHGDS